MIIDCYLSPECGSEEALRRNISQALAEERMEAAVNLRRIDDEAARALNVTGSPAIFINGRELQPQTATGFS